MKNFYHATPAKNLDSILSKGIIVGLDGITYLAESKEDAYKFGAVRCFGEDLMVIEVELDEAKVVETFDHSYTFFQCRAFGYPENIPQSQMLNLWMYTRRYSGA